MSISEVLLFVSSNSRACIPCLNFVSSTRFPANIVRLDTDVSRKMAANGNFFQINSVPTMVVIYDDGNTQLFMGAPKILQWMKIILSKTAEPKGVTSYMPAGGNMYGPRPNPPPSERGRPNRYPDVEEGRSLDRYPEVEEEDLPNRNSEPRDSNSDVLIIDEGPDEEEQKPKKAKPSKTKPSKKISKKKKKPPVDFEELEGGNEVEFIADEHKRSSRPEPSGKPKKQQSRMAGVIAAARQLEQDRKNSLGYKEEELPRYH